jgi:D-beta-D-heptose 7-phosphate kinase/D-beta-D-heptose 1-phosphate adenosyltransferase
VNRISPEAPVPILELTRIERKSGMSNNVAANLKELNCNVIHITGDKESTKTRFIDEKTGQQLMRMDEDKISLPIETKDLPTDVDCVVISDYGKGALTYDNMRTIIKKYNNIPIFIDTKKNDLEEFNQIFPKREVFIKINNFEYSALQSGHSNLIVTQGKKGAVHRGKLYPSPLVNVADACGAGDTFLSALAVKYVLSNKDIESSIEFANKAASITVQHLGNYAPTLGEINAISG